MYRSPMLPGGGLTSVLPPPLEWPTESGVTKAAPILDAPPLGEERPYQPESVKPVVKQPAVLDTLEGEVVDVADGANLTLLVNKAERKIRLVGIGVPELSQPMGQASRQGLVDKVYRRQVRVRMVGQAADGVALGVVQTDECVNTELVRLGLARYEHEGMESTSLAAAEEQARQAKLGLWSEKTAMKP
jgi:micrococcal nuclease